MFDRSFLTTILRGALTVLVLGLPVLGTSAGAQAQGDESRWIETWLESRFSTGDQDVRISGLRGEFRSTITIERLEIADPEGPWLVLSD